MLEWELLGYCCFCFLAETTFLFFFLRFMSLTLIVGFSLASICKNKNCITIATLLPPARTKKRILCQNSPPVHESSIPTPPYATPRPPKWRILCAADVSISIVVTSNTSGRTAIIGHRSRCVFPMIIRPYT